MLESLKKPKRLPNIISMRNDTFTIVDLNEKYAHKVLQTEDDIMLCLKDITRCVAFITSKGFNC